jgi:CheY-like chemotaxis protein/anti-sigma regulatory factor (Ser/Thr protein kinase)
MSHELRTPLNAVLGFSQLLLMDGSLTQPQRDKLLHIQRAPHWLLEMIGDLMDLSMIETGDLTLKLEAVDLRSVIAESLDLFESHAAASGIRMVNDATGPAAWVRADRSRLKQVLLNLISNALKCNRPQGDVHIAVFSDAVPSRTRIEVRDSGVGLTPEQVRQLFEPFNRLGGENLRIQGTGIGLVIAKQLVQAMGGQITAQSLPGQGSTFAVTLADVPRAADAGSCNPHGIGPAPDAGLPPAEPETAVPGRVELYVGDDPSNLLLLQAIAESVPRVRLEHADTAERAPALSRELDPAVVLIDINLAGPPGMHLLKTIKAEPALQHFRCIAIDAGAAGGTAEDLGAAGFETNWPRPLDLKTLWSGLNAVLSRQRPHLPFAQRQR